MMFVFSVKADNAEFESHDPDGVAHRPDCLELLPDVDLHDVQCVAVYGSGSRSDDRLLPVRLEEV